MSKVDKPSELPAELSVESTACSLQEKISSMVDGELSREECSAIIAEVCDGSGSSSWDQYHLIGEAMRHNLPDTLYTDLSTSISAAIAAEPAHQMGAASPAVTDEVTTDEPVVTNVVPAVTQVKSPIFGYAVAASISMVAIAGMFQLNQGEALSPVITPIVVAHQPQIAPGPVIEDIAWSSSAMIPAQTSREPVLVQHRYPQSSMSNEKLNRYIINHNEHSIAMPAQSGMLPYVRLVGYERSQ
jgi:sigma-E factor negative regulatory protein RseA